MSFDFRAFVRFLPSLVLLLAAGCGRPVTPGAGDPKAITVEGVLGRPVLLASGSSTVYARLRIGTLPRPAADRGPVNVALVMDTSGSMEGAPIVEARKAALGMVDAMKNGDRLAIVVFHTEAETLLPPTELDAETRADVKRKIGAIEARGTTELAGGLALGIAHVREHLDAKGINRIVLLGDGIPNRESPIEPQARDAGASGIGITTLGLGLDYDETLMGKIADLSGGRFKYVESADKVAGFLREETERLDTVYARRATATLTPGPGVVIESVVGVPHSFCSGRSACAVSLGDVARGDTRDLLVRLTVTPRKAGVPIELLDTVVSYDDALDGAGTLRVREYLGARTTTSEAEVAKATNADVELSAALAEASATTIRALEVAKGGRYKQAREMLTKGSEAAVAQAKRTPSDKLSKQATDMVEVAKGMPEADAAPAQPASGYEFSDDPQAGETIAPTKSLPAPSPAVLQQRKEVHSQSYDALH